MKVWHFLTHLSLYLKEVLIGIKFKDKLIRRKDGTHMKISLNWEGKNHSEDLENHVELYDFEIIRKNPLLQNEKTLDGWIRKKDPKKTENWKNQLIWGDNKKIMQYLLTHGFKKKIQLIYIDPPFSTGDDFKIPIMVGNEKYKIQTKSKELKATAYSDKWEGGHPSYLTMIYERLKLMKKLLHKTGLIFVHVDYRAAAHIKLLLDEIFGSEFFVNEVIWCYKRWTAVSKSYQKCHDNIYIYAKSGDYCFNTQYVPYADDEAHFNKKDEKGKFRWQYLNGNKYKVYLKKKGVRMGDWWNIQYLNSMAKERTNYPTQKPEKLLQRIIETGSNKRDIVADFFCGSGTTGAVSERLGRKWILTDQSPLAIQTTRNRLLSIPKYRKKYHQDLKYPILLRNLKYDRSYDKIQFKIKNFEIGKYETPDFENNEVKIETNIINPKKIEIALEEFNFKNTSYFPHKIKDKVSDNRDYIKYWAIEINEKNLNKRDENYKNSPIKNENLPFIVDWCSFRTRNRKMIETSIILDYSKPIENIRIKVVDIWGNIYYESIPLET